jgi:6-phosphogluconolactonase (cycloisomerase 2 family)
MLTAKARSWAKLRPAARTLARSPYSVAAISLSATYALAHFRGGMLTKRTQYSSGNIVTIPLSPAPPYLPEGFAVHTNDIQFSGTGPRTDRQDASHPHHVYYPQNELLVADLGADKVWRLGGTSVREVVGAIDFAPGGGPRHVLYHGKCCIFVRVSQGTQCAADGILYTVLELSSELAAHTLPALPKEPQHLGTVSTYGAGSPPNKEALAAEILFIPARAGAPPRLLVSNRNDTHEGGDTIAVFALADKAGTPPRLIGEVRTGLKHIRGMSVDPSNNYLVTGGLHGPGVKVFEIADEGEWLREIASVEVASPTAFMWI